MTAQLCNIFEEIGVKLDQLPTDTKAKFSITPSIIKTAQNTTVTFNESNAIPLGIFYSSEKNNAEVLYNSLIKTVSLNTQKILLAHEYGHMVSIIAGNIPSTEESLSDFKRNTMLLLSGTTAYEIYNLVTSEKKEPRRNFLGQLIKSPIKIAVNSFALNTLSALVYSKPKSRKEEFRADSFANHIYPEIDSYKATEELLIVLEENGYGSISSLTEKPDILQKVFDLKSSHPSSYDRWHPNGDRPKF